MPPKRKVKTDDTHLVWTVDEVQLLLETTRDFKFGRVYEGVDWESVKEEYEKKREKFVSNLPHGDEIFLHPASIF